MVCHGDAFNVARHIAPCARVRPWPPSTSLSSQYWINVWAEWKCRHRTRKLGLRACSEVRGSVTVLCNKDDWSRARTLLASELIRNLHRLVSWTTEPLAKREARYLSSFMPSSDTVISRFERSENVARLSSPFSSSCLHRGVWPTDPFVSVHAHTF